MYVDLSHNLGILKVRVKWSGAEYSVPTEVSSQLVEIGQASGERVQLERPGPGPPPS
jgi:hypothetical protein